MTARTVVRHLAARDNFRQRHYAPLSERGQRIAEQGRVQRVELTPTEKAYNVNGVAEKGNDDATVHRVLHI